MGAGNTFGHTENGIYFGTPEILANDPFFGGEGPSRSGCYLCGECLTGCKHGSKNTLDKNYLYLAQKYGAVILPYREVTNIVPQQDGSYILKVKDTSKNLKKPPISRPIKSLSQQEHWELWSFCLSASR